MRVIVEIGHPAHVHHFKNMIWELKKYNCKIKIVARKKDIAIDLLEAYGFNFDILGVNYNNIIQKAYGMIKNDISLLLIAQKFKPDIFVSRASPHSAHVSRILHKPHIAFCDTEHANLNDYLAYPFTDIICTSSCYKKDVNPGKHVILEGYKELAYLHPNYFTPDVSVLDELGLKENEKYIVIRLVSWKASHDIGDSGIQDIDEIINALTPHGRIFITAEDKLPDGLERYSLKIAPEKIHSVLYFAELFLGESSTMATESAVLGVPSIFISTSTRGYTDELEDKYDLLFTFSTADMQSKALDKALEILNKPNSREIWEAKKERMLKDKIDVSKSMTELVLNHAKYLK